jgi:hypothetical protein
MLLIIIVGLSISLVMEHRRRHVAEEMARANVAMARASMAEANAARAKAEEAVRHAEELAAQLYAAEKGSGTIDAAASERKATAK